MYIPNMGSRGGVAPRAARAWRARSPITSESRRDGFSVETLTIHTTNQASMIEFSGHA
jgi:hypothetical protein